MDAFVEKAKTEPLRMVVLSPYWPKQSWFDELSQLFECSHVLRREETRYLPRKGLPTPPAPHWETVLFRIDTVKQGISPADPNHTKSQETTTKKENKDWGLKELKKNWMPPRLLREQDSLNDPTPPP